MPYLSPPPSTSARSVCLSLNTIQVQIAGARLTKQVQQTLLRRAQQALLRQAQQALPNWPNIYKFATQTPSLKETFLFDASKVGQSTPVRGKQTDEPAVGPE